MRTLNLLLLALLLQLTMVAQKRNPKDGKITSRYFNGTLFAKVNFASLLDAKSVTIQPGLEYRINKKMSVEFAVGIPVAAISERPPSDSTYHKYFKLRGELHFFPKSRFFYIGPEILFMHKEQSNYAGRLRLNDGHHYDYSYAEIKKNVYALGLKIGKIFPLSEKLNIEGSFSLGPRFVDLEVEYITGLDRREDWYSGLAFPEKQGFTVGIHMAVGAKLSYSIF